MLTLRQDDGSIKLEEWPDDPGPDYEPTPADWEEYRLHLEREEAAEIMDRTREQERHRREQFNQARSAACVVRGIAASLASGGMEGAAARLMHAAADVMIVINQYA